MSKFTSMSTALVAVLLATVGAAAHAMAPGGGEGEDAQPVTPFVATLSRAEVRAEAQRARMAGEIAQGDQTVALEQRSRVPGLTRAQVVAELREAVRLGVIGHGDELIMATPAQQSLIRMAGERALAMQVAAR